MDHQTFAALLGNYGEFFGSLAVLATLLILVFQIRGARTEFSNQMRREIKRHNNDDIKFLISDPRTMSVHIQAQRGTLKVCRRRTVLCGASGYFLGLHNQRTLGWQGAKGLKPWSSQKGTWKAWLKC